MIAFTVEDVFLVTGASSGLGAAGAVLLNKLGATVIASGRDEARLREVRDSCEFPDRCLCEPKDLSEDIEGLPAWVSALKARHGKLRGLLYAAGVCEVVPARAQKYAAMKALYDVNVFAAYQVARGFLDKRNNSGRGASVVFIASISAFMGDKGTSAYASSKGALVSLAVSLASEYAAQGLRVNAVSPGTIESSMTRSVCPNLDERMGAIPLGLGSPDDIARASAFLLSGAASWITGQNLVVDGGLAVRA